MTNGDYIRQMMTDDHIALRFCGIVSQFNSDCIGCDGCPLCDNPNCAICEDRLKWLKAEYVGEKKTENLSELQENGGEIIMKSEVNPLYTGEKYVKSIDEMLDCFKKGWGVEFSRGADIKGIERKPKIISSEASLSDYIRRCPVNPVEELNRSHLVHNWREFHLYFGDFGNDEGNGECFCTYLETVWAIYKEKDHIVRTSQVSLCTSDLWNHGFRIFVHPECGFGDVFEIFVGSETFDSKEIRKSHDIDRMLINGSFGWLFSGHDELVDGDL